MANITDPASYNAWYHTPRGRWISGCEYDLLLRLMRPRTGESLLDVGCGTGHFSRRFAQSGLSVTGIDPDPKALDYAAARQDSIEYLPGTALNIPFGDDCFDHTTAITSLCFIKDPVAALQEMWRVTKCNLVLGLLNRNSLLYRQKHGRGNYMQARWDAAHNVRTGWIKELTPTPKESHILSAVFLPQGSGTARFAERVIPKRFLRGGFLAVSLRK
jgi:SAM-dependent methyltransferase